MERLMLLYWSCMNGSGCWGIMSLSWDCMDDRNVREGIDDEESNVVSRVGFIKYHLMDVYSMLATYGIWLNSVRSQILWLFLFVVDFIKTLYKWLFLISSLMRWLYFFNHFHWVFLALCYIWLQTSSLRLICRDVPIYRPAIGIGWYLRVDCHWPICKCFSDVPKAKMQGSQLMVSCCPVDSRKCVWDKHRSSPGCLKDKRTG